MFYLLLTLLIIDAFLLMVVVLLQSGKGGGLAAMGGAGAGSDTLFGTRQAATLLTRLTWWGGGIFLGLAFVLSILSSRSSGPGESILRDVPAGAASAPVLPGVTTPVAPAPGQFPAEAEGETPPPVQLPEAAPPPQQ